MFSSKSMDKQNITFQKRFFVFFYLYHTSSLPKSIGATKITAIKV